VTEAPLAALKSLEKLIKKNKRRGHVYRLGRAKHEVLLGDVTYFQAPNPNIALEEDVQRLPARQLWRTG